MPVSDRFSGQKLGRLGRAMSKPQVRYGLVVLLVAGLAYGGWTQITRTRGAQKVAFVPAAQTCDASGPLRYCVYRDRRGANGDIVYHLHGRRLDERIWNDDTYLTGMLQGQW